MILVLLTASLVSAGAESMSAYEAAVYSSGSAYANRQQLILFPLNEPNSEAISLPFPLGLVVIDSYGTALYAQKAPETPGALAVNGIVKIDLNPTRVSTVSGSVGFRSIFGLVISPKKGELVVSGGYSSSVGLRCGVFLLNLIDGSVSEVLDASSCHRVDARTYLSVSADGSAVAAIYHNSLEVINLDQKTNRTVAEGVYKAEWSPDGKWIAAIEHNDTERTLLFDALTLREQRALPTSDLHWSPDSRYLTLWKWQSVCGPGIYSLEVMDVKTGKTSIIESSKCKLVGGVNGWLSKSVLK